MKLLLTSDIHLTDSPRDSHRFQLFKWLREQQNTYTPDAILVLGDITNKKDNHSSALVNQLVDGFRSLVPPVYINRGNHDCIRQDQPFFKFLSKIEGLTFCTDFTLIDRYRLAFIPHQTNQDAFDNALRRVPEGYIACLHQTVTGAISETGTQLTGFTVPPNKARAIYSGDIHMPHTVDQVTYIGAPYPVRFGDSYEPRVLLLHINDDNITEQNLYFEAPKKLNLQIRTVADMPKLNKGDQVKITFELTADEAVEWANHKKELLDHCEQNHIYVYGITLKKAERRKRVRLESSTSVKSQLDYFRDHCNNEKLSERMRRAGLTLIQGSNK